MPVAHLSIPELIDHIVERHHAFLRSSLPELRHILRVLLEQVSEPQRSEFMGLELAVLDVAHALDEHMEEEERYLFPRIRALYAYHELGAPKPESVMLNQPICEMDECHERTREKFAEIRKMLTDSEILRQRAEARRILFEHFEAIERDFDEHIFVEDFVLFPKVVALEKEDL